MPHYQPIVDGVLMDAHKELGDSATDQQVANLAFQRERFSKPNKPATLYPCSA